METILIKSLLSIFLSLVIAGILFFEKPIKLFISNVSSPLFIGITWFLTRIIPFFVVYIWFDYIPFSDISGFFNQATHAARGEVVYRDFYCMYSPFFPYINGFALLLWNDKRAIVLIMILLELITVISTFSFFKTTTNKTELLFKILIYWLLPSSFMFCVLGGQEDELMWLMVVLSFLMFQKTGRLEILGIFLLLGFLVTKAVFVLFLPALLFLIKKPIRWIWPMAVLGMMVLLFLYNTSQWEFIGQPTAEANTFRAPNLPSVLSPITFGIFHFGAKFWNWIGLIITVGMGVFAANRFKKLPLTYSLSAVWVLLFGTMMVVQQSAYSSYIFIFLLPLSLVWIDFNNKKEVVILLVFNVVAAIHPSLWWRLQQPKYTSPLAIFQKPIYILDYGLQILVLLSTLYFLRLVWKKTTV